jgi:hypothetical protein
MTNALQGAAAVSHSQTSSSAKADDPVFTNVSDKSQDLGVLDAPLEPVIGLAEGETRWRGMTRPVGDSTDGRQMINFTHEHGSPYA